MKNPSTMCDTLEITTSVGCPNACKVCPQARFVSRYGKIGGTRRLGLQHFRQCLSKIPKHVRIDFSGFTEPWSNPECTDMILSAHMSGYKITVFTTCVGMTELDVDRIESIPFFTFVVHLPDEASIMPFPKVKNYGDVLKRLCSSTLAHIQFMAMGSPHSDLAGLIEGPVSSYLLSSRAGNLMGSRPVRKSGSIRCIVSPKLRRNILLPNGDVVMCCHDYGMDHVLGNLLTGRYEDFFTSPQYRNVLTRQNDESQGDILCRYCDWSGSRLKAKSVWGREVVKEAIQPLGERVKQMRNLLVPFRS